MITKHQDVTYDDVIDSAAMWKSRLLSGSLTAEEYGQFQDWLDQNPDHHAEFEAIEDVWCLYGEIRTCSEVGDLLEQAESGNHGWLNRILPGGLQPLTNFASNHKPIFAVLAASIVILVASLSFVDLDRWNVTQWMSASDNTFQTYRTDIGEQLRVQLDDGSTIHLDAQTSVSISFSSRERRVQLDNGQALFSVASDPVRPFVVRSGDLYVEAVGTEFEVSRRDDKLRVAVIEGIVSVHHSARELREANPVGEQLNPGQQITFASVSYVQDIETTEISNIATWRYGRLIFESTPLSEAVADFNLYSKTQITISDPKLNELQISGVFKNTDSEEFITALTDRYSVRALRTGSQMITLIPEASN